jgi:hypothetical protein
MDGREGSLRDGRGSVKLQPEEVRSHAGMSDRHSTHSIGYR